MDVQAHHHVARPPAHKTTAFVAVHSQLCNVLFIFIYLGIVTSSGLLAVDQDDISAIVRRLFILSLFDFGVLDVKDSSELLLLAFVDIAQHVCAVLLQPDALGSAPSEDDTLTTKDSVLQLLRGPEASLRRAAATAVTRAFASLQSQCVAGVAAVQSISTMYRMTGKPAPTRPSPYLPKILKPLQEFLHDHGTIILLYSQPHHEVSL